MRCPGEGDEFHGDVGFGGLERDGFESLVEGIGRGGKHISFRFELCFEIGQLLLQCRHVLFGLPDVTGLLDRASGSANRRCRPADVRRADRLPPKKCAQD